MRRLVSRMPCGRYRLMNYLADRCSTRTFRSHFMVSKKKMYFDCDLNDSIRREVCFTGLYEPLETSLVKQILGPGKTFVDVGANWGYFTLIASVLVGEQGSVIALEPEPGLFSALDVNVRHNELKNVTVLKVAASNTKGEASFTGSNPKSGNSGLNRLVANSERSEGVVAETDRLDDLLNARGVTEVSLMKMDIEGAEGLAMEGSSELLESHRIKVLLLELHPGLLKTHGHSAQSVVDRLIASGYRGYRIPHDQSSLRSTYYSRVELNVEALQPIHHFDDQDLWPHYLFRVDP